MPAALLPDKLLPAPLRKQITRADAEGAASKKRAAPEASELPDPAKLKRENEALSCELAMARSLIRELQGTPRCRATRRWPRRTCAPSDSRSARRAAAGCNDCFFKKKLVQVARSMWSVAAVDPWWEHYAAKHRDDSEVERIQG